MREIFLTAHCKKFRQKSPYYRYQKIVKNENISLSYDVNNHIYSQVKIRLWTDLVNREIRQILPEVRRILIWIFDYHKVGRILT